MNDTAWQFYISTPEAWEAMLAACKAATRSIDLEQFIFSADAVGQAFCANGPEPASASA